MRYLLVDTIGNLNYYILLKSSCRLISYNVPSHVQSLKRFVLVSGALRPVRAVHERCPQHLLNDSTGHAHLDTIHRLAVFWLVDLPVLRTPAQRGAVEPAADCG